MGAMLEPRDELRDKSEIAKRVEKRPLPEVQQQVEHALKQMLYRAHCGDKKAMLQYALVTHAAVESLQTLAKHQPARMWPIAESFSDWPVLLSLNPEDIKDAKHQLKTFGVGTKSPLPTKPGQRVNRRNFWTRLAIQALKSCATNKRVVPALKTLAAGAIRQSKKDRYWGITVKASLYSLANGDEVIITDWQNKCVKLSGPITKTNFPDWWNVIKSCVLEHWKNPQGNYADALQKAGGTEEWQQRNRAISQVKQALRSLVGLR